MQDKKNWDLLEPYITNLDDQVFSIVGLNGITGAVMARYSRAETGLRETLLREFIKEDKLQWTKAEKLIERVLIAFGDDSVGELEGAHLALEDISMLATKVIEHRRIGGSPIEKSTRYVRFDRKDENGAYLYVVPPGMSGDLHDLYVRHMDTLFDGYTRMWEPIHSYLKTVKPLNMASYVFGGGPLSYEQCGTPKRKRQFEKTYENDLKTKTCDVLRAFLPLSTKANVGVFGNGRFYQHLISKMLSSPLVEANILGEKALNELSKVIPHFVKRACRSEYQVQNHENMLAFTLKILGSYSNEDIHEMRSIEPDYETLLKGFRSCDDADSLRKLMLQDEEISFLTSLIYPYSKLSFNEIKKVIALFDDEEKKACYRKFYGDRQTRRDRPERSIEFGYPHHFEMITEWAVYKDLMRHRMGTALIQPLNPHLGFEMPKECLAAGVGDQAEKLVQTAESLHNALNDASPENREYAFLHGHKMRWLLGMNDRALMHMLELRTTPQGHPNYRHVCQQMHAILKEKFSERAGHMKFVNHNPVFWSRADSEALQREKEDRLED